MTIKYFKKNFEVVPLSWENLEEVITTANKSLPHHASPYYGPESAYRLHLKDPNYGGYAAVRKIRYCEYYVLITKDTRKAVGVTGFYVKYGAAEESVAWLDWFGIIPEYQGIGLGSRLFNWVECHIIDHGFETAKLFTSSRTAEANAQIMYESLGYSLMVTYRKRDYPFELYLRKKNIKK